MDNVWLWLFGYLVGVILSAPIIYFISYHASEGSVVYRTDSAVFNTFIFSLIWPIVTAMAAIIVVTLLLIGPGIWLCKKLTNRR